MGFLSKIFGNDDEEFNEVRVDREVLDSVIYYAKKAYPNEFLAFFDGEIIDNTLFITSLIFVPGETSETGAIVHTDRIPMNTKYWGSVHSHPGPSASPSDADLMTFSKNGYFHMIVCLPYSLATFKAYDRYGNPQKYIIGDYSHLIEDESDEFFDEDDVLKDSDEFKPGLLDEADDEFFTTDDTFVDHYKDYEENHLINNPQVIKIEIDSNGNVKRIYRNYKK